MKEDTSRTKTYLWGYGLVRGHGGRVTQGEGPDSGPQYSTVSTGTDRFPL